MLAVYALWTGSGQVFWGLGGVWWGLVGSDGVCFATAEPKSTRRHITVALPSHCLTSLVMRFSPSTGQGSDGALSGGNFRRTVPSRASRRRYAWLWHASRGCGMPPGGARRERGACSTRAPSRVTVCVPMPTRRQFRAELDALSLSMLQKQRRASSPNLSDGLAEEHDVHDDVPLDRCRETPHEGGTLRERTGLPGLVAGGRASPRREEDDGLELRLELDVMR